MKQFRRDKIRLYAFMTACLLLLVLLFSFGVSASELGSSFVSDYDISSDDILIQEDSDLENSVFIPDTKSQYYTKVVNIINKGLNVTKNTNYYYHSVDDYPKYFMCFNPNNQNLQIVQLPENSFVTVYDNSVKLYCKKGAIQLYNSDYMPRFVFNSNGVDSYDPIDVSSYKNPSNVYTHDGIDYGIPFSLSNTIPYRYIISTNCPIYKTNSSSDSLDSVDFDTDYNYISGGNSSDDESDLNNLYLPTSDFKWNCSKYGDVYSDSLEANEHATENMIYSNRWGSGGVQFSCVPTDYQIAHADDFYITFEFQFWTKGWVQFAYGSVGDNYTIAPTNSTFSSMKMFTNPYSVDIELSDIIKDGNQHYFVMQDLFDNSTLQQYNLPYLNFNGSIYGSAVRNMREYYAISWDNSTDLGWKGQARAVLHSRNINNEYSGNNTETYNFLTQISKQTDDSMSTNNYPYSPNEDDVVPDGGGGNSQTMTSDNGQIILTNNDNDTININDGNAETVENIYNDLTTSDGEDSLSERFKDLVNENAWITIMQKTFSFIPSSIWVSVEIFVVTCLGILAASFVLRIILDLL